MRKHLATVLLVRIFTSNIKIKVMLNKIKELEQLLDFHTQMGNDGIASILKAKIDKAWDEVNKFEVLHGGKFNPKDFQK